MSGHFRGANLNSPGGDAMAAATDAGRPSTGRVPRMTLDAAPGPVDLGGVTVHTWSYGGQLPGPEIRARRGDVVRTVLANRLPGPTTIHWHGIALRNDMDGVPGLTQAAVAADRTFTYQFPAEDPGTYWYHPHVGVQLDRGLSGPLIVEDPAEVLDDWIDGTGYTRTRSLLDLDDLRDGAAAG